MYLLHPLNQLNTILKILFLYNESELEGKGNIDLFSITKKLEKKQHQTVMVLQPDNPPSRKKNVYPILPKPIKGFLTLPSILKKLLKIVSKEKPDIILCESGWYFPLLLNFFSFFNKTPYVFNFRGLVLEVLVEWKSKPTFMLWIAKIYIKINNHLYKKNKLVIGTNDSLCKYYEDILGIDVPLVGTHSIDLNLYKPISEDEKQEIRKKYGFSEKLIKILYTGGIEDWHAEPIKILCDVARELSSEYPIQLIIGGWGKKKETIRRYMEDNKMMKFSILLPWLDHSEILKIIASCDICVDPLIRRFPMNRPPPGKLIEYMSCGSCIITTKCENNMELIKHKQNGLLFSGSKEDLKEKLDFILTHSEFIRRFGLEARKTIETKHYEKNKVENLEKYFKTILAKN